MTTRCLAKRLALFLTGLALTTPAAADTMYVDDDGIATFTSIHTALTSTNAGDTVLVAPGEYDEHITMKEGVILRSAEGPDVTTIKGTVTGANNSAIIGFSIVSGGDAVYCNGTSPAILNNVLLGQQAGVYITRRCSPLVANNVIMGGISGGVYTNYGYPTIVNNVIRDTPVGVRVQNEYYFPATLIRNNIIASCDVAILGYQTGHPTITSNLFWDNNADIAVSPENFTSWSPTVAHNLNADPLFVDPASGDYHVHAGSPCVDAGNDAAVPADVFDLDADGDQSETLPFDLDGRVRIAGATVDLGPYEHDPNRAPVADAGEDQILDCTSSFGASVTLDGSASYDPDGDVLSYEWSAAGIAFADPTSATPTALFPTGPTLVTLTVTDGMGGLSIDDVLVVVEDITPPILLCTTDVIALWPPDHKMVPVEISLIASDACSSPSSLLVYCTVESSEPDDARGDGALTGDVDGKDGYTEPVEIDLAYEEARGAYVGTVWLRAERDGRDEGRCYSIVCDAADASGNTGTASCVVVVPHDKRTK